MCVCVCAALVPNSVSHFFSVVSAFELQYSKRYTSLRVVFSTLSIRSQMCQLRLFLFLYAISLALSLSNIFALYVFRFGSRPIIFNPSCLHASTQSAFSSCWPSVYISLCAFALLFIYIMCDCLW